MAFKTYGENDYKGFVLLRNKKNIPMQKEKNRKLTLLMIPAQARGMDSP